jgi:hypothetical protein
MSIEARARGTVVMRLEIAGTALALLSQVSIAQVADEESDPGYESRFICEEVPGGTVCTRANFDGPVQSVLFNQVRLEIVLLLRDAATCISEKPNLTCGRRQLDSVLGMTDLNSREAGEALLLDMRYWICEGNEGEARRTYERFLDLPQNEIPALAPRAQRMLEVMRDIFSADAIKSATLVDIHC